GHLSRRSIERAQLRIALVLSVFLAVEQFALIFFFQAEDGIRDRTVTGVQTCALPISATATTWASRPARSRTESSTCTCRPARSRSEERRVGKECRTRRRRDQHQKQTGESNDQRQSHDDEQPGRDSSRAAVRINDVRRA